MPQIMLSDIKSDIERAIRKAFGSFELDYVEVHGGKDHDDDAAVFVTAVLKPNAPLMPGEISSGASVAVAQVIHSAGDERRSYLDIKRPDDEFPEDEPVPPNWDR